MILDLNHTTRWGIKRFLYNFSMYKKASLILIFYSVLIFQQEKQSVVSVADTDKGKEAIALAS